MFLLLKPLQGNWVGFMEQEFLHFKLWHLEDQGLDSGDLRGQQSVKRMIKRKNNWRCCTA